MRKLMMCGIPRSGSTLVWQILNSIFPGEVPKTHIEDLLKENRLAIITVRDPRDVAASRYRVRLSRSADAGGPVGLEEELHMMMKFFQIAKRIMWYNESVVLRYEEFWDNHHVIYDMIQLQLGVGLSPIQRQTLSNTFGLEANRMRASRLRDFNEIDADAVHGDHIGAVIPGSWKTVVPQWAIPMVEEFCRPLAKEWDYEID